MLSLPVNPLSPLPTPLISRLYYYFFNFVYCQRRHALLLLQLLLVASFLLYLFSYRFSLFISPAAFVIYLLICHSNKNNNNSNNNEGIRYNSIIFIVLNSHFRSQCGFAGESNIVSIVCYFWQQSEPCWPTIITTISKSRDTIYTIV